MAARKTPSSPKPDKLMRDALMLELHQVMEVPDPADKRRKIKIKKLRLVAKALINEAIKGDVPAAREICDRIDGKVAQTVKGTGRGGAIPIQILESLSDDELTLLERIAALVAGSGSNTGD